MQQTVSAGAVLKRCILSERDRISLRMCLACTCVRLYVCTRQPRARAMMKKMTTTTSCKPLARAKKGRDAFSRDLARRNGRSGSGGGRFLFGRNFPGEAWRKKGSPRALLLRTRERECVQDVPTCWCVCSTWVEGGGGGGGSG